MGRADVEVRTGSISCDVWVLGACLARPPIDDVSRSFRNSFLGHSSSHSVLVRPVNSWGFWMEGTIPFFLFSKTGWGCATRALSRPGKPGREMRETGKDPFPFPQPSVSGISFGMGVV
jgi:hypothetical protein